MKRCRLTLEKENERAAQLGPAHRGGECGMTSSNLGLSFVLKAEPPSPHTTAGSTAEP